MIFANFYFIFQIEWLYLTYGIMFGGGSSLTYTPSLVILGHYFKRHMGMVNGFVTTGSSIFTLAMPHILEGLLSSCGVSQGRLKRWTSQLDLGNTTGGLETVVSVHNSTYITLAPNKSLMDHDSQKWYFVTIIVLTYCEKKLF